MFAPQHPLDELELSLDRLHAEGVSAQSPAQTHEVMLQLLRVQAKLAAYESMLCRKFEVDREWAAVGVQTPAAYVARCARVPSATCTRPFSIGRKVAAFPAIVEALAAGDISTAHRDKILAVDNPRVHDALVADQELIVGWAARFRWKVFEHLLAEWLEEHDADGPEPRDLERNSLHLSQGFGGRWRLDGDGDPIGGGIVAAELERLERHRFEAEWAAARERLGREPTVADLEHTPAQRRWLALVTMARRSATGPEEHRAGSILLSVFVGVDAMRKVVEADDGTALRPTQLVPWLDDATFETLLFDTSFRTVTASQQRTYRGAIRRAVLGRDRECFHEFCDQPVRRCQVDHRVPANGDGPTDVWNGQAACGFHNRHKGAKDPSELEDGP